MLYSVSRFFTVLSLVHLSWHGLGAGFRPRPFYTCICTIGFVISFVLIWSLFKTFFLWEACNLQDCFIRITHFLFLMANVVCSLSPDFLQAKLDFLSSDIQNITISLLLEDVSSALGEQSRNFLIPLKQIFKPRQFLKFKFLRFLPDQINAFIARWINKSNRSSKYMKRRLKLIIQLKCLCVIWPP